MIILRSMLRLLAAAFAVALLVRSEGLGVVPVISENIDLSEGFVLAHIFLTFQFCCD